MSKNKRPSVKDEEMYESLREDGASKEKAARIANASDNRSRKDVGESGGSSSPYPEWTKEELYERAQELDIEGRSQMDKDELISALRNR